MTLTKPFVIVIEKVRTLAMTQIPCARTPFTKTSNRNAIVAPPIGNVSITLHQKENAPETRNTIHIRPELITVKRRPRAIRNNSAVITPADTATINVLASFGVRPIEVKPVARGRVNNGNNGCTSRSRR